MKRALLILLLLFIFQLPSNCANKKMIPTTGSSSTQEALPNIFIYSIPDDTKTTKDDTDSAEETYINDTQPSTEDNEEEILLNMKQETTVDEEGDNSSDDNIALGATVLKGYAQYVEDSNSIYLKDNDDNFVLNIKTPQKISASKGLNLAEKASSSKALQRYADTEYHIAPNSVKATDKIGNFTLGALYGNEVDNIAMLETETGLFTKYENAHFAVSSSVKKSLNTTYALDYNTFSISPELKLNSYISLKNTLKADVTRNRRTTELTFSVNPFGKKDKDKLLLEAGAKQTYYADSGAIKTQLNFQATFKL